jgi:hypothetical protein
MKNTGPSYPGDRPTLKTPTDLLTDAVRELAYQTQRLTELASPSTPTLVATIPPRSRRIQLAARSHPVDAVCFAVWSEGSITPIVLDGGQLTTVTPESDWAIVGEFE